MMTIPKRTLAILFGTLLLSMVSFGIVLPIIPIIFTDQSSPSFVLQGTTQHTQLFLAGAIVSLWGLMQFIAAPILGQVSDIYGRKRILLVSIATQAVSQIVFGLGIVWSSVILLFIARAIAGLAAGAISAAQAAIADITVSQDRAKNFGLVGGAIGIGLVTGPFISGWITGLTKNAATPFWVAFCLEIINFLFVLWMLPETHREQNYRQPFMPLKAFSNIRIAVTGSRGSSMLYLTYFSYVCGFGTITSFSGVFLVRALHFSSAQIGSAFAFAGICQIFAQLVLLRRLVRHYSESTILRCALIICSVCVTTFAFFPMVPSWVVFTIIMTMMHGLILPNLSSLISKNASGNTQGAALGISSSLLALSNAIVPIGAGLVSGYLGITTPFVIGGVFILAAWTTLLQITRSRSDSLQAAAH